jgi:ribosomal protein S18 acetylase RimI-like enzyme
LFSAAVSDRNGEMSGIIYRSVEKDDIQGLKDLHIECFPIRYEDIFFENICNGKGFKNIALFTQVAIEVESSLIVGCILGQFIESQKCDDDGFFNEMRQPAKDVFYILTLGLREKYRRSGLGTDLLLSCLKYAAKNSSCGAIYLHVIHDNRAAIKFYEKNGFSFLRELVEFYCIDDKHHSSYLYILYLNGFEPPILTRLFGNIRKMTLSGIDMILSWARRFRTSAFDISPRAIHDSQ